MARFAREPRRNRRPVAACTVGVVGTLVLVLGACLSIGNPNRPKVDIVGDSITSMSQPSIVRALTPGYQLNLYARPGATMYQLLPAIKAMMADDDGRAADWILEAGTNDMAWLENGDRDDPYWWWALEQEVAAVASAQCVVLLTVSPVLGLTDPNATLLDADIDALPASHPNFHVLTWGTIEYENPSWVEPDHIHPTRAGQAELARLELGALHADC